MEKISNFIFFFRENDFVYKKRIEINLKKLFPQNKFFKENQRTPLDQK